MVNLIIATHPDDEVLGVKELFFLNIYQIKKKCGCIEFLYEKCFYKDKSKKYSFTLLELGMIVENKDFEYILNNENIISQ